MAVIDRRASRLASKQTDRGVQRCFAGPTVRKRSGGVQRRSEPVRREASGSLYLNRHVRMERAFRMEPTNEHIGASEDDEEKSMKFCGWFVQTTTLSLRQTHDSLEKESQETSIRRTIRTGSDSINPTARSCYSRP
ncbi:hypothetical protein HZH66_009920 [Vespula vulgaris]|uniref:Uncharacterized protein n=1 Tax=Vespula vulgaris TaxID=7454 RepID=A0A834JHG6_VESVU|nr:hypothetical protein HZH66_009920 [Vespula vulgaris]